MNKLIIAIFFVLACFLNAQTVTQLQIIIDTKTFYVPVYDREGTIYFSVKTFADVLSVNNIYDSKTEKIKLNFPDYTLYVTGNDPFLVLQKKKGGEQTVIQLPTSTYLVNSQIYIPLKYSLETLIKVSGKDMSFLEPDKLIINKNESQQTLKSGSSKPSVYDITDLSFEEKSNGVQVRVNSKKRIYSYNSSFENGVLTVVFRNAHADTLKVSSENTGGLIQWIKSKNIKSDAEVKIGLNKEYTTSEVLNIDNSNDLLIVLYNKAFENHPAKKKGKEKWDFNVIVLDAGHGGKDSGTLGIDGVREKDVNLAVALKLGNLIQKQMKDVKVVYTRKSDKFIELYRRGQIANEAGGKLFISIHCNATPQKPSNANGTEVYLLRPGRTKEAISIASRENSVIKYEDNPARYQKLTDENFILVSMAQSSYLRYSEKFADLVNNEVGKNSALEPRGVKQAGFFVLVGASMPSVLIETGFLSNKKDEHYLNSSGGQTHLAESIFSAIKKFREVYEHNIEAD
ncbi:MAG: N-acetylmuramoyl-L-alanine amidase [Ignavibacteriaceae bacterium]